jgi:hypothetical protein
MIAYISHSTITGLYTARTRRGEVICQSPNRLTVITACSLGGYIVEEV